MILLVLFLAIVAYSIKATLFLPTSEYSALQDLFDNTEGLQWRWVIPYSLANGYPWNFTNPYFSNPCNASFPWQGVKCVTQGLSSHVSQLQLPSYQLTGKICVLVFTKKEIIDKYVFPPVTSVRIYTIIIECISAIIIFGFRLK